ncbi:hypothetical protein H920_01402 [Fukomys damarensis]|uniref:Uncharacterized protein n=1 Tax=Fukomys damarensis TaxID=885580 RepID=A0A091E3U8_FUKDA|nr:hypothetical protein H920_01402 [Fukomys damarensis]
MRHSQWTAASDRCPHHTEWGRLLDLMRGGSTIHKLQLHGCASRRPRGEHGQVLLFRLHALKQGMKAWESDYGLGLPSLISGVDINSESRLHAAGLSPTAAHPTADTPCPRAELGITKPRAVPVSLAAQELMSCLLGGPVLPGAARCCPSLTQVSNSDIHNNTLHSTTAAGLIRGPVCLDQLPAKDVCPVGMILLNTMTLPTSELAHPSRQLK